MTKVTTILGAVMVLFLVFLLLIPSQILAQGAKKPSFGRIAGKVIDAKTGAPLAFGRVQVAGTTLGAFSDEDGNFAIQFVPVGVYNVQASMIGYTSSTKTAVAVDANKTAVVNFQLGETITITTEEIVVEGVRPLIQKESSSTRHAVSSEDIKNLPVESYQEALRLKAGVVATAGELHFRGGRGGEVLYTVDGIPVRDPLVGGGVSLSNLALSNAEVLSGGLDAQYGNALSGVVNLVTKEGGDKFTGEVRFLTDDYGARDKTYDNYDKISIGVGGPTFVPKLTYFVSAEGNFQDTYLKTAERRPTSTILDFIKIGQRQSNELLLQGKLSYKMGANYKLSAEFIRNDTGYDSYRHRWNRDGWVQTRWDTTSRGEIVERFGEWSWYKKDSSYVYYNPAEHTPNVKDLFNQMKLVWNHTISKDTYYSVRVSRHTYDYIQSVQGKAPWQYQVQYPQYWWDSINFTTSRYYVTHGDYPRYYTRNTKVWTVKSDVSTKFRGHIISSGAEGTYNDMRLLGIDYPVQINAQGLNGGYRSDYHYFNPEGSAYIQDRWEHEGMVLNSGLRYDVFDVGNQIESIYVTNRAKTQLSPRLGIAYPISDRDVMSFHYGRYYQIPDRRYVFEDRANYARVLGNPNLEPETTISYQAAVQHLFTSVLALQLAVYYKDIFGLISTQEVNVEGSPAPVPMYVNKDYGSARGVEVSLVKRFSHNFQGEISYTYGIATGINSDPEQERQTNYLYLPTGEQPLDWDQRHTLSSSVYISEPNKWGVSFVWQYNSGLPFTPRYVGQREIPPSTTNSLRRPSTTSLDMQGERYYKLWGQNLTVFAQGLNLLDAKNIVSLSPDNWPPGYMDTADYLIYYTMTRRAGGAYNSGDNDGDGIDEFVPVNDPRVFSEGRFLRIGIGLSF
ncbi:MAG: TonB-dependent receptor [Candidatus Eisenbacteria bacterium]|nr:TonB-dependent receptor [Candidatus Eisenbacteria bacterium]